MLQNRLRVIVTIQNRTGEQVKNDGGFDVDKISPMLAGANIAAAQTTSQVTVVSFSDENPKQESEKLSWTTKSKK